MLFFLQTESSKTDPGTPDFDLRSQKPFRVKIQAVLFGYLFGFFSDNYV